MNPLRLVRLATLTGLLLLPSVAWFGCSSASKLPPPPAGSPGTFDPSHIREGDVISIIFPGAPTLSATNVTVPFDGRIKLPFAEPFAVSDKTTTDIEADILKAYGSQLQLKEVTVTRVFSSARVYVDGAVLRPGPVALSRPMTILEAIGEAGGFDHARAVPKRVLLIRQEGGMQNTFQVDLNAALKGQPTQPIYVLPSDTIFVPIKKFNL